LHPQRREFDVRPDSELLDTVADWHTTARDILTGLREAVRHGRWTSAAGVAGVGLVAAAAATGVLLLIGWAIAAVLSWLAGHAGSGMATVWHQVIHPAIAAPIDAWFAAHAGAFGFDPAVVMWAWLGIGGVLLLTGSLRSPAGVAIFLAWLGWATTTTAIVYTTATADEALLSAGIAAVAALMLSLGSIIQLPTRTVMHVTSRETQAREEISKQTVALTAARELGDEARIERIHRSMRDQLAVLYPEDKPDGHWRAEMHQYRRESRAEVPLFAGIALAGAVLLTGMTGGHLFPIAVAVLAAVTLAVSVIRPSADETYAAQLRKEHEKAQQREADAAVLREAEATLRSVPLDDGGNTDKQ